MPRFGTALCSLLLALLWLGLANASVASSDAFKIIVHPRHPASTVERAFLHDAFLKKATHWPHGEAIRPIDLAGTSPVRERFAHEVLNKSLPQLKSYWIQRIFSGTGLPPPEADSAASAIAYVLANPGAISYLPLDVDPGGAKVIAIH